MPDWLVQVLIQYPIVLMVGFVAWYAYREVKAGTADHFKRERELHAAAIADLKETHEQAVAAVKAEIEGLKDALRDELKRLTKKVDDLGRRLGG